MLIPDSEHDKDTAKQDRPETTVVEGGVTEPCRNEPTGEDSGEIITDIALEASVAVGGGGAPEGSTCRGEDNRAVTEINTMADEEKASTTTETTGEGSED